MNTGIVEFTKEGEVVGDVFSRLVENRILFISDILDDAIASEIVAMMMLLDLQAEEQKITLYLNTTVATDIRNIFMIYDVMRLLRSPIETICVGEVLNETVLLLAAGSPGMRYAMKNASISISSLSYGEPQVSDMGRAEIFLKQVRKDNDKFIKALSKCTKKSVAKLLKDTENTLYLNPNEAIKYGIIDGIIKNKKAFKSRKK